MAPNPAEAKFCYLKKENDQPVSCSADMTILKEVGFKNIEILWKEYREAVVCAQKKKIL